MTKSIDVSRRDFLKLLGGAVLLTGSFISLSGCSDNKKNAVSLSEYLNKNKENTMFDNVIAVDDKLTIVYDDLRDGKHKEDQLNLGVAVKKLENILDCYNELKKVDGIENFSKNDESYREYFKDIVNGGHSLDDIRTLINSLNDSNNLKAVYCRQKIKGLFDYYDNWIKNNGINISRALLLDSIKNEVLESLEVTEDGLSKCVVDPYITKDEKYLDVIFKDEISKTDFYVRIYPGNDLFTNYVIYGESDELLEKKDIKTSEVISYYNDTISQLIKIMESDFMCKNHVLYSTSTDKNTYSKKY